MWNVERVLVDIRWFLNSMIPGFAAAGVLFLLSLPLRKKRLASRGLTECGFREWAMLLFWMFTGGMAVITLAPEPGWLYTGLAYGYWHPYFDLGFLSHRVSLIPFSQLDSLFNVIGNIVMFLPFGFFAAMLWRWWDWKRALALGLGITCCIECWQILVGRYFDIDDIIFNALGVLCGYLLWRVLDASAPGLAKKFHVNEEHR